MKRVVAWAAVALSTALSVPAHGAALGSVERVGTFYENGETGGYMDFTASRREVIEADGTRTITEGIVLHYHTSAWSWHDTAEGPATITFDPVTSATRISGTARGSRGDYTFDVIYRKTVLRERGPYHGYDADLGDPHAMAYQNRYSDGVFDGTLVTPNGVEHLISNPGWGDSARYASTS